MNSREKAWHNKSIRNKPKNSIQDRMKTMKFIEPWSKEAQERADDFAKKYGRAWWIFQGVTLRHRKYKPQWIMQYYKKEENRNE